MNEANPPNRTGQGESSQPARSRASKQANPSRRIGSGLLWVALTAAAVFAAWQVNVFFHRPDRAGCSPQPGRGCGVEAATEPIRESILRSLANPPGLGETATAPGALIDEMVLAEGIEPLEGDPASLTPPKEAKQLFGFRRKSADSIQEQATYEVSGEPSPLGSHYLRVFQEAGLELLSDRQVTPGERILIATGENLRVIVTLIGNKSSGNVVQISVASIRSVDK